MIEQQVVTKTNGRHFRLSKDEVTSVLRLYDQGSTLQALADKFDIDRSTVRLYLVRAGREIRDHKGTRQVLKGSRTPLRLEACSLWKGGSLGSYGRLTRRSADEIGMDRHTCQQCGCVKPYVLEVHHVNRNIEDNNAKNLVVLCHRCHSHTRLNCIVRNTY